MIHFHRFFANFYYTGILEKDEKILLMLSLLFFTTAGFSEVSDTLVTGGYDKQAMSDAIQHARKETDQFIEIMNKKMPILSRSKPR